MRECQEKSAQSPTSILRLRELEDVHCSVTEILSFFSWFQIFHGPMNDQLPFFFLLLKLPNI